MRSFAVFASVLVAAPGLCQNLVYLEPGNPACPAAQAPTDVAPTPVHSGAAVPGSLSVACGFGQGSYTVTLSSSDPDARFVPKTFLVNFGSIGGDGAFTVTFATPGIHTVSAAITSNMGSPPVPGRFASPSNGFKVLPAQ